MKTLFQTYGCQMNAADSETAMGILDRSNLGVEYTESQESLDLAILNTCSVREHAEDRAYGLLRRLGRRKETNPSLIVGVLGCMAVEHRDKLFENFPHVDFILSQRDIDKLPQVIADAMEDKKCLSISREGFYGSVNNKYARRKSKIRAFVSIMHGCDNFCTFCIVPFVRGRETSRTIPDVISEVKLLRDQGYKHIQYLGQNVNSYGNSLGRDHSFVKLLEETAKIDGIELIDYMTPHPKDANNDLFDLIKDCPKISKSLHLPIQSGSDRILERMNRGYTQKEFLDKITALRSRVPNITLSTDIIVGFPSETESNFEDTLNVMDEVIFDSAYIFKYSPRPHTKAYKMRDDVDEDEKARRLQNALSKQAQHTQKRNKALIGSKVKALIECPSKKNKEEYLAVTWNEKLGILPKGNLRVGDIVDAELTKVIPNTNSYRLNLLN